MGLPEEILSHWLLFGFASFLFYCVASAIYNFYFSPLAKYPGPFLAKISSIPNFYHATTGKRHIWIWQCHQIYGTKFRFCPDGLMINSPAAYRDIYNSKANISKTKFYEVWAKDEDSMNTLTTIDKMAHARKRRVLNSVFSEKSLRSAEQFILKHVDRWNELILGGDGKDWGEPRNMADWSDYLVVDILGDLCFGRSFGIKEPGPNPIRSIPHVISGYASFMYPVGQSPMLHVLVWLKARGLQKLFDAITPVEAHVERFNDD